MAITTIEGVLQIDLADVYGWLGAKNFIGSAPVESMEFSIEEDALVLQITGKEPVHVDAVDLWMWVIDHQLPSGIAAHETVFGVPAVHTDDGHYLQITFASSNESDPRSWARAPACLAEWKSPGAWDGQQAQPPEGYETWLDFAISCLDITRAQRLQREDPKRAGKQRTHESMVGSAKTELAALRALAA